MFNKIKKSVEDKFMVKTYIFMIRRGKKEHHVIGDILDSVSRDIVEVTLDPKIDCIKYKMTYRGNLENNEVFKALKKVKIDRKGLTKIYDNNDNNVVNVIYSWF